MADNTLPGTATFAPLLRSDRLTMTLLSYDDTTNIDYIKYISAQMAKAYGEAQPKSVEKFKERWAASQLKPTVCKGLLSPGPAVYFIHEGRDEPMGPIIGTVTLNHRGEDVPPDVGFGLTPEYHGKGYASEAVKEVLNYWRYDFGISGIMLCTSEHNEPAIRLAERIGFVKQPHPTVTKDGDVVVVYLMPGTEPMPEGKLLNIIR